MRCPLEQDPLSIRQHSSLGGRQAQSSGSLPCLSLLTDNRLSHTRALSPQQEQESAPRAALEGCAMPCALFSPREPCGAIAASSSGSAGSTCSPHGTWCSTPCACSDRTPLQEQSMSKPPLPQAQDSGKLLC